MRAMPNAWSGQRGAALIILMVILVLGATWYFLSALNAASSNVDVTRRQISSKALAEAKQALLGYVATLAASDANPGRLPCPEPQVYVGNPDKEGIAGPGIGAPTCSWVGRLPWRTLGISKLTDGYGEPLWFIVSPGWALPSSTATLTINSNSSGQIFVDGDTSGAVALIVAPGGPLNVPAFASCAARAQNRNAPPPNYLDYLELCVQVASSPDRLLIATAPSGSVSDQILRMTSADLLPSIEASVAARIEKEVSPEFVVAAEVMPGASAGAPIFPFAAAWTDPTTSTFGGTPTTRQGLLPLLRSRKACDPSALPVDPSCNAVLSSKNCDPDPAMDPHCDLSSANAWSVGATVLSTVQSVLPYREWTVSWNDGSSIKIGLASNYGGVGLIGGIDCSASNTSTIQCNIQYGRDCPATGCNAIQPRLVVTAQTGTTTGGAFRRVNPGILDPSTFRLSGSLNNVTLKSNGRSDVTTEWLLPWSANPCDNVTCSSTILTIPSLYIEDNVALQARLRDAPTGSQIDLRWFLRNNWHQLMYFAVAPGNAPGGGVPCAGATCLSVNGVGAAYTSQRALMALTGQALSATASLRPAISGYLEGTNADADSSFERKSASSTFNDRIVLVDPRP